MVCRMQRRAQRVTGLGTTIFAEMSQLALRTGAVNLGQGFPDTDGPSEVLEQAVQAIRTGHNQYAPGPGVPELRHAVADHQRRHYGIEVDPDREVLITTGATEGIAAALLGLVDPGDEVVVLEPYYDSYVACIQMAGGVRRPVTLRAPDFRLDTSELRTAVTPRTRLLLINSPHNPTGTVLDERELTAIAEVAVEHDLVVVTDEVYEHLTFDDRVHRPLATFPGMAERTLTISSAGKTFSVTGWKVGWVCGPPELVASVMTAKQFLTFTSGAPLQPAVAFALGLPQSVLDDARERARGQAGPALRRAEADRLRGARAAGHLLRDHRCPAARLRRRCRVLPRPAYPRRCGRHPAPGVLRRRPGRQTVGALGILQARRRADRRARSARARVQLTWPDPLRYQARAPRPR